MRHNRPLMFMLAVYLGLIASIAQPGCATVKKQINKARIHIAKVPRLGYNLAKVDNEFYRSGQINEEFLDGLVVDKNIGGLIILRGSNPDEAWYQNEVRAAAKHRIEPCVLAFSEENPCEPDEYIKYIDYLENNLGLRKIAHCEGGSTRAAKASGLYVLFRGGTYHKALEQLTPWRGFFSNDGYIPELFREIWDFIKNRKDKAQGMRDYFRSGTFRDFYYRHNRNPKQI